MANRACELYLRLPAGRPEGWPELETLLRAARPAALLVTGVGGDTDAAMLGAFIDAAKRLDLAVLIENDLSLAKELGADGVHLRAGSAALAEARRLLGDEKSIGVSCVLSRHEAMVMAEEGADYIAFGEVGLADNEGVQEVADAIHWWAEVFEVPCVAWAPAAYEEADLRLLVEAGADFLSVDAGPGGTAEIAERLGWIAELAGPRRKSSPSA